MVLNEFRMGSDRVLNELCLNSEEFWMSSERVLNQFWMSSEWIPHGFWFSSEWMIYAFRSSSEWVLWELWISSGSIANEFRMNSEWVLNWFWWLGLEPTQKHVYVDGIQAGRMFKSASVYGIPCLVRDPLAQTLEMLSFKKATQKVGTNIGNAIL